jgi:hypothetical protein
MLIISKEDGVLNCELVKKELPATTENTRGVETLREVGKHYFRIFDEKACRLRQSKTLYVTFKMR